MKKPLLLICFCLAGTLSAQTEVIFRYDPAGNQIYRGVKTAQEKKTNTQSDTQERPTFDFEKIISEQEAAFWKGVKMAPVPVRDFLSIEVTPEIQQKVEEISVFNMLGSLLYLKKNPFSSPSIEVNMSSYLEGAYVVKFHLRDGNVYSQTILKH